MYDILNGMRIVEASSFVASPLAGMYLAQMGADVIRMDQTGGGPDYRRWPKADNGESLYWESLNKGKKSIALDLSSAEGRELAVALVTAQGGEGGRFLTNYPVDGFLSHARLEARRPDLITVRIMGQANGGPALDFTVNCALGYPQITGPASLGDQPVNQVLPAWDLTTGAYAAFAMLAAELDRRATGRGREVRIPLADVGIATVANLGQLAEVLTTQADRPRYGNQVFGAFGRDFITADGARLMIVAITQRQWSGLVEVLGIASEIAAIEQARGVSFAKDEGLRFEHRDALMPLVEGAVGQRTTSELTAALDAKGCCWGPYQSMREAIEDPALVRQNPMFAEIAQPSGMTYPVPGSIASFSDLDRLVPKRAPRLGEHTDQVLAQVLGLQSGEIGRMHDRKIVEGSA